MGSHAARGLILRADADEQLGTGHVMRCLALAQAWRDAGGEATFVAATLGPALRQRLVEEGFAVREVAARPGTVQDADQLIEIARDLDATWVVADGYAFEGCFQRAIMAGGSKLLLIDDFGHADSYQADIVLNQNLGADPALYPNLPVDSQLLLGCRYALLRREFDTWRNWKRAVPEKARRVLVTMGGADPANVTARAVQAIGLIDHDDLEITIVVGVRNPHRQELEDLAANIDCRVNLLADVKNMPELLSWADVAIAAGGTTTWERALLGLPALIVILAENQRGIAEAAARSGLAENLGDYRTVAPEQIAASLEALMSDHEVRRRISARGPAVVDGRGAGRVVVQLLNALEIADAHLLSR